MPAGSEVKVAPRRYWGKYRGFVIDINDPDKRFRIRCQVPELLGNFYTDWATPCVHPFGGLPNQGMAWVPRVGSGVWVEFEAGDINRPIWSGVWWARNEGIKLAGEEVEQDAAYGAPRGASFVEGVTANHEEPNPDRKTRYPHNHAIRFGNGSSIEIDDTPLGDFLNQGLPSSRFALFHPSGSYIEIPDEGGMISRFFGEVFRTVDGKDAKRVTGLEVRQIEGDKETRVEGVTRVFSKGGYILEVPTPGDNPRRMVLIIDPDEGKITIEAPVDIELISAGKISLKAKIVDINGNTVPKGNATLGGG